MHTGSATVISVNISPGGIPKSPIAAASVTVAGIAGDDHNHAKHCGPMNAISLIDLEDLEDFRDEGFDVFPGAMGENVTVRGLDVDSLRTGDRLRFSGGVEIELVKPRKPCYVLDTISPQLKHDVTGRCGFIAKVVRTGTLHPGEVIEVETRHEATEARGPDVGSEPGSVTPRV